LREVEHGETFEEVDRVGFFAGLLRSLLLVVGNKAVGVDDRGAALALADMAAEAKRLQKVIQPWIGKPCSITEPHRISTLIPE
jgi:hypothetical protein